MRVLLPESVDDTADPVQRRGDGIIQNLAVTGQRHALVLAQEQAPPDPFFQ